MLATLIAFAILAPSARLVVNLDHNWERVRIPVPKATWDESDLLPRSAWKIVSVDSQELVKEQAPASNLLDGNPSSFWHTEWSTKQTGYPHQLVIDLGKTVDAAGIRLMCRQGGNPKGAPGTFQLSIYSDAVAGAKPEFEGTCIATTLPQSFVFPHRMRGNRLAITFLNSATETAYLSLAELGLIAPENAVHKTDWQSQYNITYVSLGADRYDPSQAQLEVLRSAERGFLSKANWEKVDLPAPAIFEPLGVYKPWQGISYFRRSLVVPPTWEGKQVQITLGAAMQVSDVWVNGRYCGGRKGGYLPVVLNVTPKLHPGTNQILVRLDNQDNPLVPPGKPTPDLDFLYWSGLYRDVSVEVLNPVHITDPILANQPGGGGQYFYAKEVGARRSTVVARVHVTSQSGAVDNYVVTQSIAGQSKSVSISLKPSESKTVAQEFVVDNPLLWSPDQPNLYTLESSISKGSQLLDRTESKVGIRKLEFSRMEGFKINGQPTRLVGTNRHQEYPIIGNALSKNATYRDIELIKRGGFNCIRLSHYPTDPEVLRACDELGILVIPCIAGWQFYNADPRFEARVEQDIHDLIRRDRNHPCVLAWETSLNETYPPGSIAAKWYRAAHEEFRADDQIAIGDGANGAHWDLVYNQWDEATKGRPQGYMEGKPGYIREYGDYEFGGAESTTRQPLSTGEKGNLQSAWNFIWSHNRNRSQWPWTMGDGTWVMYDYHRGYDPKVESSGMMTEFREPRLIYKFFQTQYLPEPRTVLCTDWTRRSPNGKVVVFSNGDEVELWLNGRKVASKLPDAGPDTLYGDYEHGGNSWDAGNCQHLVHPPFTFNDISYEPGELKAVAYKGGRLWATDVVRTPGDPIAIRLAVFEGSKPLKGDGADAVFVYASLVDKYGTICRGHEDEIGLQATGSVKVIGPASRKCADGSTAFLIQGKVEAGSYRLVASWKGTVKALSGTTEQVASERQ